MNTNSQFTHAMKAVSALDLEPIKTKLMHVGSGEGWSLDKVNAVEKEYRRFLCLMKLFPNEATAPQVDVDTFWHYHILDTMKYARDCEQVFGYFLHHYPYVGMEGRDDDEQIRLDSGARMQEIYESLFDETYPVTFEPVAPAPICHADRMSSGEPIRRSAGVVPPPSAGPVTGTAYCAGPMPVGKEAHGRGPHPLPLAREILVSTTAYCAGPMPPGKQARSIETDMPPVSSGTPVAAAAYCPGTIPHERTRSAPHA